MATRIPALAAALALFVCVCAPAAEAETVRLRSGKDLDARTVTFLKGERIEVALERDGGTARVVFRFDQLVPDDILPLWDRIHDHEKALDVAGGADLALGLGLRGEAANRYEVAARLDPTLRPRAEAGLARIRDLETAEAVTDLEQRVRQGHDPRGAATLAAAILDGPQADAFSTAQRRKIDALARLAAKLVARDAARRAKQLAELDAAKKIVSEPKPAADDEPLPGAGAPAEDAKKATALGAIRARVAQFAIRADDAREAAADPNVSVARATAHLETAADAYLLARRLVRDAPAALQAELAEVHDDLRLALVTTYLDLADLYRQAGRYDEARARVRAALILDPGNEQAWQQRKLIEDDLRNPPAPDYPAVREPAVQFYYWSPSPFYCSPYGAWGGCHRYPRAVPYGGVRLHARFGFGHHHHGGVRRVVGRRR